MQPLINFDTTYMKFTKSIETINDLVMNHNFLLSALTKQIVYSGMLSNNIVGCVFVNAIGLNKSIVPLWSVQTN